MEYYWDFSRDNGSMKASDYPYKGRERDCGHKNSKVVARAGEMKTLSGDIMDLKEAIQDGPFTIAVGAGNNCWFGYDSGILSYRDNCPHYLDHAVTVVGLGTDEVTFDTSTPNLYEYDCRLSLSGRCRKNKIRRRYFLVTYCCKRTMIEEGTTSSETMVQDYWIV